MERLSKDHYLWHIAFAAAKRGTCDRFYGGCVIARDGVLISSGYVGSAPGELHCSEAGHELVYVFQPRVGELELNEKGEAQYLYGEEHCIRTIHAEINAILNAAFHGISINNCDWYCTGVPCRVCSMAIARLNPRKLFVCADKGCVEDDKDELFKWWANRYKLYNLPRIFSKTLEELKELGVAV